MANVYVVLPVPDDNGPGAWVNTSGLGAEKAISVDGGGFAGTLYVEGSNDGQASAVPIEANEKTSSDLYVTSSPLPFTTTAQKAALVTGVFQWMRVRRVGGVPPFGTPTVRVGAPASASNIFATVPTNGTPVDLSAGGDVNTFTVQGDPKAVVTIEISEDGTTYSPAFALSGGQVSENFRGVISKARVGRVVAPIGSGSVVVAVGSGTTGGGGGPVQVPRWSLIGCINYLYDAAWSQFNVDMFAGAATPDWLAAGEPAVPLDQAYSRPFLGADDMTCDRIILSGYFARSAFTPAVNAMTFTLRKQSGPIGTVQRNSNALGAANQMIDAVGTDILAVGDGLALTLNVNGAAAGGSPFLSAGFLASLYHRNF